jgi:AraC-like DNA-binding protein
LKKRDMLQPKSEPPRGVLHLGRNERIGPNEPYRLERFEAGESLRPFVEHYWAVTWENQPRVTRETAPHPSVHLVLEPGRSELHGVYRRRFSRVIEGSGRVLGLKFRPGGFRAFLKENESVSRFTGKVVAPSTVFGPAIERLEAQSTACPQAAAAFELVDAFLVRCNPVPTAELGRVSKVVPSIVEDRSITRVEMLVERFDIGLRQLQRLFRDYVGVSPKWVIQRYRLIEAAERLRSGDDSLDFAALAFDLGYADQPHFIRDFKNLVGMTPADYRKSLG